MYIKDIITCFMLSNYCGVPGLNMQQCFQQQLPKRGTDVANAAGEQDGNLLQHLPTLCRRRFLTQGFGLKNTQKLLVPCSVKFV